MRIFPAIDLRDGKVVRLTQGDYDRMEVYSADPVSMARAFKAQGAGCLHVVDLDGAKDGMLVNDKVIRELAQLEGLFIEVGGGIRDEARIQAYLQAGVSRVILGTVAITDYPFVQRMAQKYGAAIAVGVDARDGMVAVNGWKQITDTPSLAFCEKLAGDGVQTVIYTDISKDGTLSGTNLEAYRALSKIQGLNIVASGGISYEHEILALKEMGIGAAIVGKAVYAGKLDLKRIIELARTEKGEGQC